MAHSRNVLYFAENALSAIQGGGIVAYAVLKGLPAEHLLGFYEYRNITPVPEYADRFVYLGGWRTPAVFHAINRITLGATGRFLHRAFTNRYVDRDLAFVEAEVARRGFEPEAVYYAGLSYRYLRLAVLAAERYGVPMVQLNMDDWMAREAQEAGRWKAVWGRRTRALLTRASAMSLVSTSNSPRLAERLSAMTGYRHVAANNCCDDLMRHATTPAGLPAPRNRVPVITYAGAMNQELQGETLKVLASAVTELNAEGTPVHLHVYTPWQFAPDANSIAVPNAVFYKGQVGREQLADIYRASDFLATTVTYRDRHITLFRHSLSTKLSEYLCAGKPVISMGHYDWHMHEYVQDNGCGFSIAMDENFSRAAIKAQLRRILATDAGRLARIGESNRALWERAHDVAIMAQTTRRALGLSATMADDTAEERRGALWLGSAETGWVPAAKLKAIARRLVDVFEQNAVDIIGGTVTDHPEMSDVTTYCRAIGLFPTLVVDEVRPDERLQGLEPAGIRWSLADAQRSPTAALQEPQTVFAQVAGLRGHAHDAAPSPVQRVINQLSIRVSESAARRPIVWCYGSLAVGREVLEAIEGHPWLSQAVEVGGFLSSPSHCSADTRFGYAWRALDTCVFHPGDLIVVTSETSRLAIQETLSQFGLRDRVVPAFGSLAMQAVYERHPAGPGQAYRDGSTARDYATRELVARVTGRWEAPIEPAREEAEPLRAA